MGKLPDTPDKEIEKIMDNAQTLINFCSITFVKPSQAWYACLVSAAILTAELDVPVEVFLEGFEQAYKDAMKTKNEIGDSYDH